MTNDSVDVEHSAREFPSPKDSRPARSLTYRWGGHIYQAVIGRQRRLCDAARGADGPGTAAGSAGRASGNTVLSIVATEAAVEIWSREPTRGWPNPSLVAHDAVLHVDYLDRSDTIAN
jgi:hypothetical protein